MSTFSIAQMGEALMKEFFALRGYNDVRWVPYDESQENRAFQFTSGDCQIVVSEPDKIYNVEVKFELSNRYKNLFIETWSNRSSNRPGWLVNLKHCELLYYGFLQEELIYPLSFAKLRAFDLSKYTEKSQKKYDQKNDTWGVPVPIVDLKKAGVILGEYYMADLRKKAQIQNPIV